MNWAYRTISCSVIPSPAPAWPSVSWARSPRRRYHYCRLRKDHKLYSSVWQAGAILLPVKSVGVMGDERTYEFTVALRAVTSVDGMTADWAHLPYTFLADISNEIINNVKGINRVVYDISSKPPATIEWE